MKLDKDVIINGFISLGFGVLGTKILSSWFPVFPEWTEIAAVPVFSGVSYELVNYLRENAHGITGDLKNLFLDYDTSEEDKQIKISDEEARKQNKKIVLKYFENAEGDYFETVKSMIKGTPGSLPCIVNFLNFMDENYSSEITKHCNISQKDLIVELLTAIIGCGYNGEAVEFDASNVRKILIELPYGLNWKYASKIEKKFMTETENIDFENQDYYFSDCESEYSEIFDLNFYDDLFQQHIKNGDFDNVGTIKYRTEDLEFMMEVYQLMLDKFGDEILVEDDRKNEVIQLAYRYAYNAGCYAAFNRREFVDKHALLGCFKGWEGLLNHNQKMELFDAVCESHGYEYHPYKKVTPFQKNKSNIIQFPNGGK